MVRLDLILEAVHQLNDEEFAIVMKYRDLYSKGALKNIAVVIKIVRAMTGLGLKNALDLIREGR
jgi:ribosomal protein L7/L12